MFAEHDSNLGQYALKRIYEMMERHPLIGKMHGLDRATRERTNDESEAAMCELGVKLI